MSKVEVKVEVKTGLDPEFDELLQAIETGTYKEVNSGIVTLYANVYEIEHIKPDISTIMAEAAKINAVYKNVSFPAEAIEILRGVRKAC